MSFAQAADKNNPPVTAVTPHGERVAPLEPKIRRALGNLTNTSSQGLQEHPHPAGGYTVDLQGRFKTVPVATVDEDGNLTIQEYSAPPSEE